MEIPALGAPHREQENCSHCHKDNVHDDDDDHNCNYNNCCGNNHKLDNDHGLITPNLAFTPLTMSISAILTELVLMTMCRLSPL